jgi:predicted transcriptional regulator
MARKSKAQAEVQAEPLTGKTLLQKLKEISHLSRREKARECGYYTVMKDDQIRITRSSSFLQFVVKSFRGIRSRE